MGKDGRTNGQPTDLLEPVGRSERRHWGEIYLHSLLLDRELKSIEPLATRLPEGSLQAMQQFIDRDGKMKQTAPIEVLGCTIDASQDDKRNLWVLTIALVQNPGQVVSDSFKEV